MTATSVAELVRDGRLESVPPDIDAARAMLADAARHLASAETVAEADPGGAYQLLYDSARKAVCAHMLAGGYRVRNRQGAHQAVVLYAEEALEGCDDVVHLDRMRRSRNRSEYDLKAFGTAEVAADLAHAHGIVASVARELGGPR